MKKDRIKGKELKTKMGTPVKVLAADLPTAVMVEEGSHGWVWFFVDPKIAHGRIYSRSIFSYAVSKSEFFEKLDAIVKENEISADDEKILASKLIYIYYKIPTLFINMIVKAYINSM